MRTRGRGALNKGAADGTEDFAGQEVAKSYDDSIHGVGQWREEQAMDGQEAEGERMEWKRMEGKRMEVKSVEGKRMEGKRRLGGAHREGRGT